MLKLVTVVGVAWNTEVKNKSKFLFIFYFVLTHCMHIALRKAPAVGRLLKRAFAYIPHPEFVIRNTIGTWIVTPFNDTMTISADYFEKELLGWPSRSENKRIFLDIGANIGKYTFLAGNVLKYQRVIAIEANPATYAILKRNIDLNECASKVTSHNVAVGETEGTVLIQSDSHHLGGGNIVQQNQDATMDNQSKVQLTTVDSLLNLNHYTASQIDFIKIDVEGMEAQVFRGMEKTLADMPKGSYIMVEISEGNAAEEILRGCGFVKIETRANDNLFQKK